MDADDAWSFIVARYAQPGRAQALLREQDTSGLDIVLALFVEYLRERHSLQPAGAELAEARALVQPWRAAVIQPLRDTRRLLKRPDARFALADGQAEPVRSLLKDAELRAERVELELLCDWADRLRRGTPR